MRISKILRACWNLSKDLPTIFYHWLARQLIIQDLKVRGVEVSRAALVHGSRRITCSGKSFVGAFSVIWCDDDPTGVLKNGKLVIGNNVYIGDHCSIRASGSPIIIGDNVLIANGVTIVSANHGINRNELIASQPWTSPEEQVIIGSDVWIGAHAVILPGAAISDGSIIAAGSVVRSSVPPCEIWGGVPAKKLRDR
jgi:acetyltransferase-like isoleucine patch superfamily enzyme